VEPTAITASINFVQVVSFCMFQVLEDRSERDVSIPPLGARSRQARSDRFPLGNHELWRAARRVYAPFMSPLSARNVSFESQLELVRLETLW
jgi:hypothetical protein